MSQNLRLRIANTGLTHEAPRGSNLEAVIAALGPRLPEGIVCATVNHRTEGLHYMLFGDKDIEFLGISSPAGMRVYTHSLFFVLYHAARTCLPQATLRIDTPVAGGYYCRIDGAGRVDSALAGRLLEEMRRIVADDLPFHRITRPTPEAIEAFRRAGLESKAKLLESTGTISTTYYTLGDSINYFYSPLLVSTGRIGLFGLEVYDDRGLLLRLPDAARPGQLQAAPRQPKLFDTFREQHRWQRLLGISTVGEFNSACDQGHAADLITVSEALQEKKIARIAETIAEEGRRVVLIAGPSSSGKTTFSKRLGVQLIACGKRPRAISLDDYFVDREKTPLDAGGGYDFEHLHAMDIPLFESQMQALLAGTEVELPRFNFQAGRSESSGRRLRLEKDDILILEGIHALNPELTAGIVPEAKYRIYASALTTMLYDDHNYIPTTDNRLLRRIVRDYRYRGYSALDTLRRWPSVRKGERRWIFPFQEEADTVINTALLYELSCLRVEALPLLESVPECEPEYAEAHRLRRLLQLLRPLSTEAVPPNSLLREFLGGSTFRY